MIQICEERRVCERIDVMRREQAHGELQGQVVTGEERVRMQEALQRLNNLDNASESSSQSDLEDPEGESEDPESSEAGGSGARPLTKKQRQDIEALAEKIEQVWLLTPRLLSVH